jgi:hypothetical protein
MSIWNNATGGPSTDRILNAQADQTTNERGYRDYATGGPRTDQTIINT